MKSATFLSALQEFNDKDFGSIWASRSFQQSGKQG